MQSPESRTEQQPQIRTQEKSPAEVLPARRGWFCRLMSDLFFASWRDRRLWLLPLILVLLILGALLAFAVALGPAAPFLYPLL